MSTGEMGTDRLIAVLIMPILTGIGLFCLNISAIVSYLAIGSVTAAFIALLTATRNNKNDKLVAGHLTCSSMVSLCSLCTAAELFKNPPGI